MISQDGNSFIVKCDWPTCRQQITDSTAQAATDKARLAGFDMQIKRLGDGQQHVFCFCSEHAFRFADYTTEGAYIAKPPPFKFQKRNLPSPYHGA